MNSASKAARSSYCTAARAAPRRVPPVRRRRSERTRPSRPSPPRRPVCYKRPTR
jgi:hypothetical protein